MGARGDVSVNSNALGFGRRRKKGSKKCRFLSSKESIVSRNESMYSRASGLCDSMPHSRASAPEDALINRQSAMRSYDFDEHEKNESQAPDEGKLPHAIPQGAEKD